MNATLTNLAHKSHPFTPRALGVLVVDEELPYPLTTGKRIRSFNLLKHLASKHRIRFLCHRSVDSQEQDQAVQAFRDLGIDVIFLNRALPGQTMLMSKSQLLIELGCNLFSRLPYLVDKHMCRELRDSVARLASTSDIDLLHFEWTPYAASIMHKLQVWDFPKPWVVDAHNVESLIWKRYYQSERFPPKRWYIRNQWMKLDRFERAVFQAATQMIFVSEPDRQLARNEFGCGHGHVVDNGVDVNFFQPVFSGRDRDSVLFLGSLDWRPNTDGVAWLIDEIFPRIVDRVPNVHLHIVGRKPAASLVEKINSSSNMSLHADVPDVRPFLEKCGLMLVPLRIGGGSRLKIVEAAAAGLPVVSTTVGAEGLEMDPGTHVLEANSADEFASAVARAAGDPQLLDQLSRAARDRVVERYDWSNQASKLDSIWQQAVSCGK